MLNFKKNKYDVLKNVLRDDYCHLFAEYFRNKAQTYDKTKLNPYLKAFSDFGYDPEFFSPSILTGAVLYKGNNVYPHYGTYEFTFNEHRLPSSSTGLLDGGSVVDFIYDCDE